MKKKILTILFASVLSMGMLTGCFGNNNATDNNTTQNDVMDGTTSNIDANNGGTDATSNVNNNDTNTTNNDMDINGTDNVADDGLNNETDDILNDNDATNDGTEDVTAPRDDNTNTDTGTRNDTTNLISKKEASEIALSHVKNADYSHLNIHKETEDGETIYEGTITYDNREHHFEIDANSGEILEWDMEKLTR